MSGFETFILGVVQGLTEFLPVSSDGHLAVAHAWLAVRADNYLALDVALHVGTLASILIFFRKEWVRIISSVSGRGDTSQTLDDRRQALLIFLATIPTGIVGLLLKPYVEQMADSLVAAGLGFLTTAVFLTLGERRASPAVRSWDRIPLWHAVPLGLAQGLAVLSGVSRSGLTISVALMLGWGWGKAGPFSFLAAVPAILGATLLTARGITDIAWPTLAIGMGTAFAVGCLALGILMKFLAARKLWPFAVYCVLIGIFSLLKAYHVF
jgi:undecaprenyl-diphosphatase